MAGPVGRGAGGVHRGVACAPSRRQERARGHRARPPERGSSRPPLPWNLQRRLDAEAPTHLEVPTGSQIPIDYGTEEGPVLAVRVQELFGLDTHPRIAGGRCPDPPPARRPAQRPIQITRDLPGFWRGSWAAARSDMRGQYPKHPWPEDPVAAPRRGVPSRAGPKP